VHTGALWCTNAVRTTSGGGRPLTLPIQRARLPSQPQQPPCPHLPVGDDVSCLVREVRKHTLIDPRCFHPHDLPTDRIAVAVW
jgi:hypothetical protein